MMNMSKEFLGINRRNIDFTSKLNPRRSYPLVDNKLLTKRLCLEYDIPTPKLLAKAEHHFELSDLMTQIDRLNDFVVKPARGAMGNGIIVVTGRAGETFRRAGGRMVTQTDLRYHAAGIISGLYALGGSQDMVMVEERLIVHPELACVSHDGVPDLRVIVYRGYPVMAMARLPTRASHGKANLHQGAVGAGIDLASGCLTAAIQNDHLIDRHPDTHERLVGRAVPFFDEALHIATVAAEKTELGYLGVDVVVDANQGPVILELNARPGLAIQLCNRAGLLPRLDSVDPIYNAAHDASERLSNAIELSRQWRRA